MRDELVDAATRILRRDGLAKLSTRAVAREAGVSEGALYKHFATKEELLLAAVDMLVAPYSAVASELPSKVGLGDVATLLGDVAVANYHFSLAAGPILGSLHADPALHRSYLALLRSRDMGPHHAMALLGRYIAAEQRLGRLNPEVPPDALADLVMAIAHFHASLDNGVGRDTSEGPARVRRTLAAALAGFLPRITATELRS